MCIRIRFIFVHLSFVPIEFTFFVFFLQRIHNFSFVASIPTLYRSVYFTRQMFIRFDSIQRDSFVTNFHHSIRSNKKKTKKKKMLHKREREYSICFDPFTYRVGEWLTERERSPHSSHRRTINSTDFLLFIITTMPQSMQCILAVCRGAPIFSQCIFTRTSEYTKKSKSETSVYYLARRTTHTHTDETINKY